MTVKILMTQGWGCHPSTSSSSDTSARLLNKNNLPQTTGTKLSSNNRILNISYSTKFKTKTLTNFL